MLKQCVVLNDQVINIGEWDYQLQSFEIEPPEYDEDGNLIKEGIYEYRPTNPFPEGAVIEEREFTQNADGGLVLASDYAALRQAEYPNYSPYDILDEILKLVKPASGSKLEQIINERNAVKAKYPKS